MASWDSLGHQQETDERQYVRPPDIAYFAYRSRHSSETTNVTALSASITHTTRPQFSAAVASAHTVRLEPAQDTSASELPTPAKTSTNPAQIWPVA
ncbi:hypothetical protein QFZ33_001323 [Arthrobacter globiformis]|nr:hypothetical protein [Arthrobacter globiformis]